MESIIKLGEQIAKKRAQLRLTQKDIASMTGISDVTVRLIEHGKTGASIKNWLLVANALGLDVALMPKRMSDETRENL